MTADEELRDALAAILLLEDLPPIDSPKHARAAADALLPEVKRYAAEQLRAAALEYETDGEIVSALADQARTISDLASEAAYAITASDFHHLAGRLRDRADALAATDTEVRRG